ncbi:hypothetical protein BV20DRAFT_983649, partial [Pilatotrama ljubarskyi]
MSQLTEVCEDALSYAGSPPPAAPTTSPAGLSEPPLSPTTESGLQPASSIDPPTPTSASFVRLTRQRTETAPVSALDRGKSRASKAPPAADSAADSPPDDAAGDAPRDPNGDPDDILLTTTLRNNVGRQNIPALKQDVRTLFELVTRSTKAHDAHRSRTEDALLNLTTMVAGIQERLNTPSLLSPSSPIPLHDVEMRVEALVQHTEVEDNRR